MLIVDEIYIKKFNSRLYKFLKDKPTIQFKKLRVNRGYIEHWNSTSPVISLDHRDQVLSTLIHEVLHYIHPKWDEDKILEAEKLILNRLTNRQIKNIIKRLATVL